MKAGILTYCTLMTAAAMNAAAGTGVDTIGEYACTGCRDTALTVPEGVRVIGEGAFAGSEFESIELPSTLDAIGPYAFAYCSKVRSIALPHGVRHIGRNAFGGCTALEYVEFSDSLLYIGDEAFQSTALTEADLGRCTGLSNIGAWAFALCPVLKSVELPPSAIILGEGVFMGCADLSHVDATGTGDFPPYLFAGCTRADLSKILAESHASSIGAYALSGNDATKHVSLPATLEYAGDFAMERMYSLRHVDASDITAVPLTGESVWSGVDQPNVELTVAPDMTQAFLSAPQWQDFHIDLTTSDYATTGDITGADIRMSADGDRLHVEAAGTTINRVELIDLHGTVLSAITPGTPECMMDISSFGRSIYIARVWAEGAGPRSFTFIK